MDSTIVYLIRHSEQLKNGIKKLDIIEEEQIANEKIILTVNGEKEAKKVSKLKELKKIDVLFSSNYVRAIATAKYIACENNIEINIDTNFNERKLGDLKSLKELGKIKKYSYTTEQLLDENLSNINGENRKEAASRFLLSFNRILNENEGKRIVIVSHGAIIKFALLNWCSLNVETNIIEYNGEKIAEEKLKSPHIFKLEFQNDNLVNIQTIRY